MRILWRNLSIQQQIVKKQRGKRLANERDLVMASVNEKKELILEKMFVWFQKSFKGYKISFLSALIVGALTYMFAFTNKLINHDEACSLFAKGAGISSGRWGLDVISFIFPDYSMPWIYGVISVVLVAIATCVIVDLFGIRNKILQMLLGGIIMAFPSLIGTFNYMFTSSAYALAFLFSVIAARLFTKKTVKDKLLALALMVLSISIYQSYIAVTASLLLLFVIQQLMKENGKMLGIIRQGICYVLFLGGALILYYAITQGILEITETSLNSYASGSLDLNVYSILSGIKTAYVSFYEEFRWGNLCLIPTQFSRIVHIICAIVVGIGFVAIWIKKNIANKVMMIIMLGLLPLSINCMYLFTESDAIHTLVLYSFISVYVLATIVADDALSIDGKNKFTRYCHRLVREIVTIAMFLVVICNVYIGNQTYLHLYLKYENAYAFYTSLITEVKMTPGFDSNSKLALIGEGGALVHSYSEFDTIKKMSGADGFSVNNYSRDAFIRNYIGIDIPFASSSDIEEIKATSEFDKMEIYPYYRSIEKIGDFIVVKLSE